MNPVTISTTEMTTPDVVVPVSTETPRLLNLDDGLNLHLDESTDDSYDADSDSNNPDSDAEGSGSSDSDSDPNDSDVEAFGRVKVELVSVDGVLVKEGEKRPHPCIGRGSEADDSDSPAVLIYRDYTSRSHLMVGEELKDMYRAFRVEVLREADWANWKSTLTKIPGVTKGWTIKKEAIDECEAKLKHFGISFTNIYDHSAKKATKIHSFWPFASLHWKSTAQALPAGATRKDIVREIKKLWDVEKKNPASPYYKERRSPKPRKFVPKVHHSKPVYEVRPRKYASLGEMEEISVEPVVETPKSAPIAPKVFPDELRKVLIDRVRDNLDDAYNTTGDLHGVISSVVGFNYRNLGDRLEKIVGLINRLQKKAEVCVDTYIELLPQEDRMVACEKFRSDNPPLEPSSSDSDDEFFE